MNPVELYVIEDNNGGGFLLRTQRGRPIFMNNLGIARTFTSVKAVRNQIARIREGYFVRYRKVTLALQEEES